MKRREAGLCEGDARTATQGFGVGVAEAGVEMKTAAGLRRTVQEECFT